MENLKDLQADEATAKIGTGSAVIKYYREARAALSYPPVMTLDTGGEYPTSHIVQAGAGDLHTLVPKKSTAIPLPDDLRPTSDDWQPIAEVTPSATAIDCGGFAYPGPQGSTIVTQPKTVQIAWDGAIKCHLCRLPYSPLKSWPWRRWFGRADKLPMYLDGLGGVMYHPQDAETVPSTDNGLPLPSSNTMASGWLTPSDMRERGYNVDTSVFSVPCVVPLDWDGSHDMPTEEFIEKMQAKSDEWGSIVTYPYYRFAPAVFAGVYTDGDLRVGVRWNPYAFGAHAHAFATLPKKWAGKTVLIGYREPDTEAVLGYRHVLQNTASYVLAEGEYVKTETAAPVGGFSTIHWYSFAVPAKMPAAFLIGRYGPGWTRIEQRRDFPVPFAPAFASIRTNWRGVVGGSPSLRGRLTDMTQPACSYGIVLHWWTEDGKSYALPFKAVAVERSASVVSETRRDGMAADLLSSGREQYNTMRGESLTRYRCAMELDEDEQRAAATLAESPFFCYTTAEDEDTRHWCEVDGVKTEWTATEAATIELTIRDI